MAMNEHSTAGWPPRVFSVRQALRHATEVLEEAKVIRPQWNAEWLLAKQLRCEPIDLYLDPPAVGEECRVEYQWGVAARAAGMPLQYLLGAAEFYGREFEVGPGVFIPRPETETLIDVVLNALPRSTLHPPRSTTVVDVGTGCGAIAVTLALERPGWAVLGVERSWTALCFARRNAHRWKARVAFLQGDNANTLKPGCVDLLVANLPYLDPQKAPLWPRELAWEPWGALAGGAEGKASIEAWVRRAADLLSPRGRMLLEVGDGQVREVEVLAGASGLLVERVVQDLAGAERVLVLQLRTPS